MIDPREHLEEYIDGLLSADDARAVERALRDDPALRAELEEVRAFAGALDTVTAEQAVDVALAGMHRRTGLRRLAVAASLAAAVMLGIIVAPRPAEKEPTHEQATILAWSEFGQRLGLIARERRSGRVPRLGIGGLVVPPAEGYGVVFRGALEVLDVRLDSGAKRRVQDLVRDHFVALRHLGDDAAAECRRAEESLALYRRLRSLAGAAVADAYYDVFRPALVTQKNVARGMPNFLKAQYAQEYARAMDQLHRRYGEESLKLVLARLSGADRRFLYRDASEDGVGRDAVLAIRARLYRVARDAGVDKLYIDS